jgi:O-antigen ligase
VILADFSFKGFLNRHSLLMTIILPLLVFGGIGFTPLGWAVVGISAAYLLYKNKHDSVILLTLFVLTMGDSRMPYFQFFKISRMILLIMLTVYTLYEFRTKRYQINTHFLFFSSFISVAVLAMTASPLLSLSINKTLSFAMLYFVALHYFNNKMEQYGSTLMFDVMMVFIGVLAIGLILLPVLPSMVMYGQTRYNGLLGNPNGVGVYVTLSTPVLAYMFDKHPQISSQLKTLAWISLIVTLLICSSRNAIFSVTIFLMVYYGMKGSWTRRIAFIFVLLPLVGLFFLAIDLQELVFALGLEKYFRVRDFESGSGRVFAWQHAIEMIQKSPIIGCGFGCEEYNFIYRTSYRLYITGHQGGVHNSYLAFTVNTGLVGVTLFYGFLFNMMRKVRDRSFMLAFIPAVLFSAMFESWMFSSLNAFHIMFVVFLVHLIVDTNKEELLISSLAGNFSGKMERGLLR